MAQLESLRRLYKDMDFAEQMDLIKQIRYLRRTFIPSKKQVKTKTEMVKSKTQVLKADKLSPSMAKELLKRLTGEKFEV